MKDLFNVSRKVIIQDKESLLKYYLSNYLNNNQICLDSLINNITYSLKDHLLIIDNEFKLFINKEINNFKKKIQKNKINDLINLISRFLNSYKILNIMNLDNSSFDYIISQKKDYITNLINNDLITELINNDNNIFMFKKLYELIINKLGIESLQIDFCKLFIDKFNKCYPNNYFDSKVSNLYYLDKLVDYYKTFNNEQMSIVQVPFYNKVIEVLKDCNEKMITFYILNCDNYIFNHIPVKQLSEFLISIKDFKINNILNITNHIINIYKQNNFIKFNNVKDFLIIYFQNMDEFNFENVMKYIFRNNNLYFILSIIPDSNYVFDKYIKIMINDFINNNRDIYSKFYKEIVSNTYRINKKLSNKISLIIDDIKNSISFSKNLGNNLTNYAFTDNSFKCNFELGQFRNNKDLGIFNYCNKKYYQFNHLIMYPHVGYVDITLHLNKDINVKMLPIQLFLLNKFNNGKVKNNNDFISILKEYTTYNDLVIKQIIKSMSKLFVFKDNKFSFFKFNKFRINKNLESDINLINEFTQSKIIQKEVEKLFVFDKKITIACIINKFIKNNKDVSFEQIYNYVHNNFKLYRVNTELINMSIEYLESKDIIIKDDNKFNIYL